MSVPKNPLAERRMISLGNRLTDGSELRLGETTSAKKYYSTTLRSIKELAEPAANQNKNSSGQSPKRIISTNS